jgi:hypothetical protein
VISLHCAPNNKTQENDNLLGYGRMWSRIIRPTFVRCFLEIALLMEAVSTSETSAYFYKATQGYIPKAVSRLHTRRRENLKSKTILHLKFLRSPTPKSPSQQKMQKLSRYRHSGAKGEREYNSFSFLTSALDGSEWSASRTCRVLPPGKKSPVPIG